MSSPWNNFDLATMDGEEWRDVVGYDGLYMVSSLGRVKSLERWVERRNNGGYWAGERIRKQGKVKHRGHTAQWSYYVPLSDHNGVRNHTVARLVIDAFGPALKEGQTIHHINGISHDNRHCNLTAEERSTKLKIEYDLKLREHARETAKKSPVGMGIFKQDMALLRDKASIAPKPSTFRKRNAMVVTVDVPSTGFHQTFTSIRSAALAMGLKEYSIRNAFNKPHKYKRFTVRLGAV